MSIYDEKHPEETTVLKAQAVSGGYHIFRCEKCFRKNPSTAERCSRCERKIIAIDDRY